MKGIKIMNILDRVYIYRIEYYNPHPPDLGNLTFYGCGHTEEELIRDLCISQNINPSLIREKCVISKLDCMTSTLLDKLITQNIDEYLKRKGLQKKKYDEFISQNQTKPSNVSKVVDNYKIYSVLD
jgi:hypothetical protein